MVGTTFASPAAQIKTACREVSVAARDRPVGSFLDDHLLRLRGYGEGEYSEAGSVAYTAKLLFED